MRSRLAAPALAVTLALAGSGCAAIVTAGTPTVNEDPAADATAIVSKSSAATGPATVIPSGTRPAPSITTLTVTSTVAPTTQPAAPPSGTAPATDLSGEVYGFVTAVDPARSELTLDKIDWFTGDAARQACAQDGVTSTDNNRCIGWYYRNNNPALRVVGVAPDATISTLNGGTRDMPGDLAAVAAQMAGTAGHSPWRLMVTDGRVTDLQEIYLP
jgi:hypothetical protein